MKHHRFTRTATVLLAALAGVAAATPPALSAPVGSHAPLLIGDSISVMGHDDLAKLRPDMTYDAVSGSLVSTLPERLASHLQTVGTPRRLVIALGTNTDPAWTKEGYEQAVDMVPPSTQVVLVTPYVAQNTLPGKRGVSAHWRTYWYARWMVQIASERPNVCVVPWRAVVTRHPELLYWPPGTTPDDAGIGGVHPKPKGQVVWARMIDRAMRASRCQGFRQFRSPSPVDPAPTETPSPE